MQTRASAASKKISLLLYKTRFKKHLCKFMEIIRVRVA